MSKSKPWRVVAHPGGAWGDHRSRSNAYVRVAELCSDSDVQSIKVYEWNPHADRGNGGYALYEQMTRGRDFV